MPRLVVEYDNCSKGQFHSWNYRVVHIPTGIDCYCGYTVRPSTRAREHCMPSVNSNIAALIREEGHENFKLVLHDGDPVGKENDTLVREMYYVKKYGTSIRDNPENSFACNDSTKKGGRGGTGTETRFDHRDFPSVSAAARYAEVSDSTMVRWIELGHETFPPGFKPGTAPHWIPIVWQGVEYDNCTDAARVAEVSGAQMVIWQKQGLTDYPSGFTKGCGKRTHRPMEWKGNMYRTTTQVVELTGAPTTTVNRWRKRGVTDFPADYMPEGGPHWHRPTWQGKVYRNSKEAARAAKVSYPTMKKWHKAGVTDYPPGFKIRKGKGKQRGIEVKWRGKNGRVVKYKSASAAARFEGCTPASIQRWVAMGLTKPPKYNKCPEPRKGKTCRFGGKNFPSHSAAAREFDTNPGQIERWIKKGMKKPPKKAT